MGKMVSTKFTYIKMIVLIVLLLIAIIGFIKTRRIGCTDKKALNYSPKNTIMEGVVQNCIFPKKGCMNQDSFNYSIYANVSCKEDCEGWLEKEEDLINQYNQSLNQETKDKILTSLSKKSNDISCQIL